MPEHGSLTDGIDADLRELASLDGDAIAAAIDPFISRRPEARVHDHGAVVHGR